MGAVHRLVQRARQVRATCAPDVPSPCISVCRMDPRTQWCEGCYRTLDEIVGWSGMSDEDKRKVWQLIEQRAQPRPDVVMPDLRSLPRTPIRGHPGPPGLRVKPAMTDPSVSGVEREQDNS
jgi:predicted Fe-S protein YdhL (DUF1289 family)